MLDLQWYKIIGKVFDTDIHGNNTSTLVKQGTYINVPKSLGSEWVTRGDAVEVTQEEAYSMQSEVITDKIVDAPEIDIFSDDTPMSELTTKVTKSGEVCVSCEG